jgi:hypothetical protein
MLFTLAISASAGVPVDARLLAMVVNDDAYLLSKCGALQTIASKSNRRTAAPTFV